MQLVCDNRRIQREVGALYELCEAAGAVLNPALRMVVGDRAIWLESDLPADDRSVLVSLPESCLPPVQAFHLEVADDRLVIRDQHTELPESQTRCFEHLVAIYNATGKLATHRDQSPWFALSDQPSLLERLVAARAGAPRIESTHARWREGPDDSLLIDTFLATRQYGLGDSGDGSVRPVLLPFIDFADHHPAAPGFQQPAARAPQGHRIVLSNAKPLPNSQECRVAYGMLDALDSYLTYGFIEADTDLVRSVPLTIELDVGRIKVESRATGAAGHKLPDRLRDIRPWVPRILGHGGGEITVAQLLLPGGQAPFALRRVLNWLIRHFDPGMKLDHVRAAVLEAEGQVLAANRAYWDDLKGLAETACADAPQHPGIAMVTRLAERQLELLEAYADRLGG